MIKRRVTNLSLILSLFLIKDFRESTSNLKTAGNLMEYVIVMMEKMLFLTLTTETTTHSKVVSIRKQSH